MNQGRKDCAAFMKASKAAKAAKAAAKRETPEERTERERRVEEFREICKSRGFSIAPSIRELELRDLEEKKIVGGSPYQTAREAWKTGLGEGCGLFDHWTSSR